MHRQDETCANSDHPLSATLRCNSRSSSPPVLPMPSGMWRQWRGSVQTIMLSCRFPSGKAPPLPHHGLELGRMAGHGRRFPFRRRLVQCQGPMPRRRKRHRPPGLSGRPRHGAPRRRSKQTGEKAKARSFDRAEVCRLREAGRMHPRSAKGSSSCLQAGLLAPGYRQPPLVFPVLPDQ